jgi:hypothetical protein
MPNRRRPMSPRGDWDEHPIVWFSALLRGVDSRDNPLIDHALAQLERLGYFVVPYPPKNCDRKGVA